MSKFLTLLLSLFCMVGFCQNSQVKVTLKSGVVITGDLKELAPSEYIQLVVSGVDTKVSMSDVQSVESLSSTTASDMKQEKKGLDMVYGNYTITDNNEYPEIIKVQIGDREMEMRLVRGGSFIMGYDGRHSISMESEPIHQVNLSSFYISTTHITKEQVNSLLNKKIKIKKPNYPYHADKWDLADEVVKAIAKNMNQPYRLCTEAEWEYSSLMDFAEELYGKEKYFEWCSDFYGEYNSVEQTNPKGPATGKKHVKRSFNVGRNKWQRKFSSQDTYHFGLRIAISADKISK